MTDDLEREGQGAPQEGTTPEQEENGQWVTTQGEPDPDEQDNQEQPEGEEKPQEDPEAARKAHYQTRYQELKSEHDKVMSILDQHGVSRDELLSMSSAAPAGEPAGEVQQPTQRQVDDYAEEHGITADQVRSIIREENQRVRQEQVREQQQRQFSRDYAAAQQALGQLRQSVPRDVESAAIRGLADRGIVYQDQQGSVRTWPSQYVRHLSNEIQNIMLQRQVSEGMGSVEASTRAKVDAARQIAQPAGASSPEPRKKTKEEQLLDKLRSAGGSDAGDEVFG